VNKGKRKIKQRAKGKKLSRSLKEKNRGKITQIKKKKQNNKTEPIKQNK